MWLDSFGIARFPVTNREYKQFLEETQRVLPPFWRDPMFSNENQPVVGVSWDEAAAYCQWLCEKTARLFRLPTEAEWERAARGEKEGTRPWGNKPPSKKYFIGCDPQTGGPAKVGVNEPNDFGLFDMSENVHEWCADYYDYNYYRYSPARNPPGPSSGQRRASRGGCSWRRRPSSLAAVPRAARCRRVSNTQIHGFGAHSDDGWINAFQTFK